MAFYYSRKSKQKFDEVVARVTKTLKHQGFGVITTIDVKEIMKQKLNIEFRNYKLLGACNPEFVYKAISLESHIGVTLDCNIVVQEHENGDVEVSAINPTETLDRINDNGPLRDIATEISNRLRIAIDNLHREIGDLNHIEALPTETAKENALFSMQG